MRKLYTKGYVQEIIDKVISIGIALDPNEEIEVWIFSDNFYKRENLTKENYKDYVFDKILRPFYKSKNIYRRNNEAPVMKEVIEKLGKNYNHNYPIYVIFISDGGVKSHKEIKEQIISSTDYPLFWQFIGLGDNDYGILEKLDEFTDRKIDNSNFFMVENHYSIKDDTFFKLLTIEYPIYLSKAVGIY